jgi:hypothetical protein
MSHHLGPNSSNKQAIEDSPHNNNPSLVFIPIIVSHIKTQETGIGDKPTSLTLLLESFLTS